MTKLLLLLMGIQLSRLKFNNLFFPPHRADFFREIFEKYVGNNRISYVQSRFFM